VFQAAVPSISAIVRAVVNEHHCLEALRLSPATRKAH
jgi:hypothetical protein